MGLFGRFRGKEKEKDVDHKAQIADQEDVDNAQVSNADEPEQREHVDNEPHTVSPALAEHEVVTQPRSFPAAPVERTRVLAVTNQKGGVGKTTTTINLGAWLALDGWKVLIVDIDAQGNATSGLGFESSSIDACIYDVLLKKEDIHNIIQPTQVENLYLVPATSRLVGAQVELVNTMSRETRLRDTLEPLRGEYHYIIVDCPPSLGLLTINAMTAADELIIPVQCEYYALEGLSGLLESLEEVKKYLNPNLQLAGLVMTMHDSRTKLGRQVIEEVKKHFPGKVYTSIIPRSVRLSEAPSFGQPITHYDALSRGAIAYKDLAKEVMRHG